MLSPKLSVLPAARCLFELLTFFNCSVHREMVLTSSSLIPKLQGKIHCCSAARSSFLPFVHSRCFRSRHHRVPFLSMSLRPQASRATGFPPSRTLADVFTSKNSHVRREEILRFSFHCSVIKVLFWQATHLLLPSQEHRSPLLAFVEYIGTSMV
ncbi:hypothetical protein K443DRAFT_241912 [Laccaria amethystina LaAM-08-1]|uniref:Uncharacterized protein n=1 Tax=Laccaria amethystina LaAM-08-1 TaxID=1095629 RepID=A0A0C9WXQ8_9AGAR|nr:hypothetical protein K443DRAFT_241912 [Laccaria amethystina LaAM-08-1]